MEFKKTILNAMKNAIQGELFESLRAITIDWNEERLKILVYVTGEISDTVMEHVDSIDTYFLSHMPEDFKSDVEIKRVDYPEKIKCLREWVYNKNELERG